MLPSYEPPRRNCDHHCMDGNEDHMAYAKILEFKRNDGRDKQACNEILTGAGRDTRARKSRQGSPDKSDDEREEEAVGLNEGMRSAIVSADCSPIVQGPNRYTSNPHQNSERKENPVRVSGITVRF